MKSTLSDSKLINIINNIKIKIKNNTSSRRRKRHTQGNIPKQVPSLEKLPLAAADTKYPAFVLNNARDEVHKAINETNREKEEMIKVREKHRAQRKEEVDILKDVLNSITGSQKKKVSSPKR
jgi:hypothetical protein